ncbi:SdpI family protein [Lachnoclostridium sp.]|uniref:SdpI family protein n=1 Tax=Lachnoclostridium sp. TaxID=2028282 RepID=UPI00289954C2|nr:SdpI family protein [Lachnoclostridium sp.]
MKKLFHQENYKVWMIAIIALLIAVIAYPFLPEEIPLHFGTNGEVDRYGGAWTIFLIPAVIIILIISAELFRVIDPKRQSYAKFSRQYYGVHFLISLLFMLLEIYIIAMSMGIEVTNINHLMPILVGILFLVLGNSMPKFKHNYFCGIKTCYTLANEDVWFMTHRFAGKLWFLGGFGMIFTVFLPTKAIWIVFIIIVAILIIVPVLYSYFAYQRINKK